MTFASCGVTESISAGTTWDAAIVRFRTRIVTVVTASVMDVLLVPITTELWWSITELHAMTTGWRAGTARVSPPVAHVWQRGQPIKKWHPSASGAMSAAFAEGASLPGWTAVGGAPGAIRN